MTKFSTRGISTLVGIIIILVVILGVGGILVWQLPQLPKEEIVPQEDETADLSPKDLATEDWQTYRNEKYGFEISYLATFNQSSEREVLFWFRVPLEGEDRRLTVRIFADEKPSVPLSGSYGGDFPFKEVAPDTPAFRGLMHSEKVVLNGVPFQKDYWIEYGGMGSWSTVINCYAEHRGKWFMISLINDWAFAKVPQTLGEDAEIRQHLLSEILDNENEYIKTFNQMLSTFRFLE